MSELPMVLENHCYISDNAIINNGNLSATFNAEIEEYRKPQIEEFAFPLPLLRNSHLK